MCIDDQKKDQMTARRRILLNLTTWSKCLRNSWTALIPTTATAIAIATNTKKAILLTTIFLVTTTRLYSFRWQLPPNILYD